ncbi:MAG: response regulator [Bacteroidales bacterium]|nr:response regulator [Bacteroidales bacterium]
MLNLKLIPKIDHKGEVEYAICSAIDVTQQKMAEEKLKEARAEAEKANRLKSIFLANMSHEIRTPMNAILGYTRVLSKAIKDKKQSDYLNIISQSGNNLMALINDILDLSKIEAGKLRIEHKPVSPKVMLSEIKNIFQLKTREKGIELITEVDEELPSTILIDETRLRQVLFNLVGNAVKFTDNGFVNISVKNKFKNSERSKIDLVIIVQDTGIGIPEHALMEIFEAFQQQPNQAIRFGGTGLGLSITKKLTEMMNGTIEVESKVGQGSIFKVCLKDVDVNVFEQGEDQLFYSPDVEKLIFSPATLLVVEDNLFNLELIAALLTDKNIDILEATNGRQALEVLETATPLPHAIIMDIKMPVMDGYETTRRVKSDPRFKHIPVIALTAEVMMEEKQKIIAAGCNSYLTKPVKEELLLQELAKYLKTREEKSAENLEQEEAILLTDEAKALPAEKNQQFMELLLGDLLESLQKAASTMQLEKWKQFGHEVIEAGKRFQLKSMIKIGENILDSVDSFNIKNLKMLHNQFNTNILQLKTSKIVNG